MMSVGSKMFKCASAVFCEDMKLEDGFDCLCFRSLGPESTYRMKKKESSKGGKWIPLYAFSVLIVDMLIEH